MLTPPARPADVLQRVVAEAARGREGPLVIDGVVAYGRKTIAQEIATIAGGLVATGVRPGDRVALALPNSADFVLASLACLWAGAIFVPVAPGDPAARVAHVLADSAPAITVVADPAPAGVAEAVSAQSEPGRVTTVAELRAASSPRPDPVDPTGLAAYAIYTSGTTGAPKGVLIGRAAFAAAVASTAAAIGITGETRALCVSPVHFDGSFATIFPTLASGGTLVIPTSAGPLFPRRFVRTVVAEKITLTGFSPSYLRLLLTGPDLPSLAGSSLEMVALGGEACTPAEIDALWRAIPDIRVVNRYGPTETTIAVSHFEVPHELVRSGGPVPLGTPHPGVSFHLAGDGGGLVTEPGVPGELCIGGSQLMDGYWGDPALTAAVLDDHLVPRRVVYRTGDTVYRAEDGNYVYVDRRDRVMKRGGVRISLLEISEAVRRAEGVRAAVCVAFSGDDGLPGIAAFVVTDRTVTAADLRRTVAGQLPASMLPDAVVTVDHLPVGSTGKVDEQALLAGAGLHRD